MVHTPGRDHKRKSDAPKRRRFQKKAVQKRTSQDQQYEAAKKCWEEMSEDARKMRPELDPELLRPRWRQKP
jgi:hypothetical protein